MTHLIAVTTYQTEYAIATIQSETDQLIQIVAIASGLLSIENIRADLGKAIVNCPTAPTLVLDLPDRAIRSLASTTDEQLRTIPADTDSKALLLALMSSLDTLNCQSSIRDLVEFELSQLGEEGQFRSPSVKAIALAINAIQSSDRKFWADYCTEGELKGQPSGPRTIEQMMNNKRSLPLPW